MGYRSQSQLALRLTIWCLNMQSATNIRIEITLAKQRNLSKSVMRIIMSTQNASKLDTLISKWAAKHRQGHHGKIKKCPCKLLKSLFPLGITASDGMVKTDFSLPVYSAVFVELLYVSVM